MYKKTQLFIERLERVGSASLLMDKNGNQSNILGDRNKEFYATKASSREERIELNNILSNVIHSRMTSVIPSEKEQLFKLQKKIESRLRAAKKMTPNPRLSFSQIFMSIAEQTLNQQVFEEIKSKVHELYHCKENDKRSIQ